MSMTAPRLLPAVLLALALASGCGPAETSTAQGGSEPTTPQALAHVAAEHAGVPDTAVRDSDATEEYQPTGVGAELRYGSTGEYDGDMLVVAVGTGLDLAMTDCDAPATEHLTGCEETDQGVLMWEGEAPEEDPGVVYLVQQKGDAQVLMFYAGPSITGDPRELDMPISVETLFAIANDPRVDVTTSESAVRAGQDLDYWQTG
jgi:hypothetical protein